MFVKKSYFTCDSDLDESHIIPEEVFGILSRLAFKILSFKTAQVALF